MFYPSFLVACLLAAVSFSGNPEETPAVYHDAVTVNGQPINYNTLPMYSRGVLAFNEGNPKLPDRKPMQFRVTLRRAGVAVQQWPAGRVDGVYSIQLTEIWPLAHLGDELVVEPVGNSIPQETYSRGKRVFRLIMLDWLLLSNC